MANGDMYSVVIIVRAFALKVRSISVIGRFGASEAVEFTDYNADEQRIFDKLYCITNISR
ncbi:hypothetical protein [Thomasclavelia cocleata]|nr:hypothetical protein [Thomasclavelia cocleata]